MKVGILGATGMVGQYYAKLLSDHPFFELAFLAASPQSAGKTYREILKKKEMTPFSFSAKILDMPICAIDQIDQAKEQCDLIFSAIDAETAKKMEGQYADAGFPVITNASYHRTFSDIPLIIPEVNPEHLKILKIQQKNRGWQQGCIIAKPNCSLQSYLLPLFPLHQAFKIKQIIVTTLQAISGAGYPGVSSLDILDNAIPYISDEEEKSEKEPLKILGKIKGDQIAPIADISIAAHCNRVPVSHGHLSCVSVSFEKKPQREQILDLWRKFCALPQKLVLPMAPSQPIIYLEKLNRPQPRLDRDIDQGMAVCVGRLRKCPVLDFRFVALSHNILRGAAGGGVLIGELFYKWRGSI